MKINQDRVVANSHALLFTMLFFSHPLRNWSNFIALPAREKKAQ
jgi:hypothetical protein